MLDLNGRTAMDWWTQIIERFQGVRETGEHRWQALCPTHDDKTPSLSIALAELGKEGEKLLVRCQAQSRCGTEGVLAAVGLELKDLFPPRPERQSRGRADKYDHYDYRDEQGTMLFQAVRATYGTDKRFWQRQPDGKGDWINNIDGVRRVLYRLPEIRAALEKEPNRRVFIVEGEKDVDALVHHKFIATCNPCGAGKWLAEYAEALRGRYTIICPDNDAPGEQHLWTVARSLVDVAALVVVLRLPGLPPGGDVSDWFGAGGTPEQLKKLAREAEQSPPCTRCVNRQVRLERLLENAKP